MSSTCSCWRPAFRPTTTCARCAIVGEGGQDLDAVWENGPFAYRTVTIPGFPNLFMIFGPHSPLLSFPIHASAELQSEYMGQMVDLLRRDPSVVSAAVRPDAAQGWLDELRDGMPGTVWTSGCTSWYIGDADVPVLYPFDRRRWRATLREPVLADYEVRRAEPALVDASRQPRPAARHALTRDAGLQES